LEGPCSVRAARGGPYEGSQINRSSAAAYARPTRHSGWPPGHACRAWVGGDAAWGRAESVRGGWATGRDRPHRSTAREATHGGGLCRVSRARTLPTALAARGERRTRTAACLPLPSAQRSLNRVRTQMANSLMKLRKIFAEPVRQGIPPALQPQHFVQPKLEPCGVRAVHYSKRLDERSTSPPSPHAARPRYVLHEHAQTAFSKLPQGRLATACCVCSSRVRMARCTQVGG